MNDGVVALVTRLKAFDNLVKCLKSFNFYIDDSGTRHPDHEPGKRAAHGYDWFSLGGILIREEEEARARELYADFVAGWPIISPLHSSEIRGRTGGFHWLEDREKAERDRFMKSCTD